MSVYTIPTYPLILAIQGPPGVGKTYQTNRCLVDARFKVFRAPAATLSGQHERDSVDRFMELYEAARKHIIERDAPSPAILIEDFDLSGAVRLENTEYTVNQQLLVSALMHLCDGVDLNGRNADRIPIYFTGNNFTKLHQPLKRHGRLDVFTWQPDTDERVAILSDMVGGMAVDPDACARELASELSDAPMSLLRFILDDMQSMYMYQQISASYALGNVRWNQANFETYRDVRTERFVNDFRFRYRSLESTVDFLHSEKVKGDSKGCKRTGIVTDFCMMIRKRRESRGFSLLP
ncbi:MAG: AAA family ATPase [Actinomyces sp.]|nr:AAA family ATPase [Actinomyces sp.]